MDTPEQKAQSAKFGYKAPESVYKKHDPKASLIGSGKSQESTWSVSLKGLWTDALTRRITFISKWAGKAFTGVSPMDFYLRQSAAKKAEKAKEAETKIGTYQHNMYKGSL